MVAICAKPGGSAGASMVGLAAEISVVVPEESTFEVETGLLVTLQELRAVVDLAAATRSSSSLTWCAAHGVQARSRLNSIRNATLSVITPSPSSSPRGRWT